MEIKLILIFFAHEVVVRFEFSSAVCHELYDHPNNLQIESDAFCVSGLVAASDILEVLEEYFLETLLG